MDFKNIIANLTDSKEKKLITTIVGVLVVIIICGLLFYFNGIGAANKHSHEEVIIDIPNGTGGSQIIEILDENGFIKNKFCAKVHVRLGGYDSLQANSYVFTRNICQMQCHEAFLQCFLPGFYVFKLYMSLMLA